MIEFNCVCKQYKFSLPLEMAGSLIQCPTCRRLVDVPTLDELARMHEDGGFKFEGESNEKKLDAKVAMRAFSTSRVDEFGEEIDLRNTFEEVQRAGVHHAPGTLDGVRPIPPKYDPVTGELIRPLAIKNDIPQRVLPVDADSEEPLDAVPIPPPKLSYAVAPRTSGSLGLVFVRLLQPANLIVMAFMLLIHIAAHVTAVVTAILIFPFILPIFLIMASLGHYANVIDEIGPGGRDELPTPLRNLSFGEDIWRPFTQITFTLFLAFLPLIISIACPIPAVARPLVELICVVAGVLVAPALVLSFVTSGTYLNLRPDRVAGVIAACSTRYPFLCITFAGSIAIYWASFGMMGTATVNIMQSKNIALGFTELASAYAVLAAGVYLMHAFCWQMGLIYRANHGQFPWILQRHVPVRMAQRTRSRPRHLPPGSGR